MTQLLPDLVAVLALGTALALLLGIGRHGLSQQVPPWAARVRGYGRSRQRAGGFGSKVPVGSTGRQSAPEVLAVQRSETETEVLLASSPLERPRGFDAAVGGRVWRSCGDEGQAEFAMASPTLVLVGWVERSELWVDLAAIGGLSVEGPEAMSLADAVLAQVGERAAEGCCRLYVLTSDTEVEIPEAARQCRSMVEVIEAVARWSRDEDVSAAGDSGVAPEGPGAVPVVIVDFDGNDDHAGLLDDLLCRTPSAGAVRLGRCRGLGWRAMAEEGSVVLEPLGLSLVAELPGRRAMGHGALQGVHPDEDIARDASVGGHREVAAPPDDGVEVTVCVLGPVEVHGARHALGRRLFELVAYLALHPGGVSEQRLRTALWPDRSASARTLHNAVSLARRGLGEAADGTLYLPHVGTARYRVGARVGTDLARFQWLVRRADEEPETADTTLTTALELVRGAPFEEPDGFEWAHREGLASTAQFAVADVAHRLSELRMSTGDPVGAQWAASQGLMASPGDEVLYCDRMLACHAAGSRAGVETIMEELCSHLENPGGLNGLHPDTLALYRRLGGRRRLGSRREGLARREANGQGSCENNRALGT